MENNYKGQKLAQQIVNKRDLYHFSGIAIFGMVAISFVGIGYSITSNFNPIVFIPSSFITVWFIWFCINGINSVKIPIKIYENGLSFVPFNRFPFKYGEIFLPTSSISLIKILDFSTGSKTLQITTRTGKKYKCGFQVVTVGKKVIENHDEHIKIIKEQWPHIEFRRESISGN